MMHKYKRLTSKIKYTSAPVKVDYELDEGYGTYRVLEERKTEEISLIGVEICKHCKKELSNTHFEFEEHYECYEDSETKYFHFCSMECLKDFIDKKTK